MNTEWQEKLASFGAIVDASGNVSFPGEPGASDQQIASLEHYSLPLLIDLSRLAVIDFSGSDAKSFLQAQVCNDLTSLTENDIQINGYCSPKGRLLALFTVFEQEEGYRLLLPEDVAQAFAKRLQMFVMRAQVTIAIRTDLVCSGIVLDGSISNTSNPIPASCPTLPETELQISKNEQMQLMRWHSDPSGVSSSVASPNEQHRYVCIAEPNVMSSLWETESFKRASWSYWRWGDINAGVPSVHTNSAEQFIPQMLNMQLIDALSFKKGCYPGQEIVARMQYLGKLKKHMKHFYVADAKTAPAPGDVLTTESNNNAGQVVDAVLDENGLNLLAVVNIDTPVEAFNLGGLGFADAPMPYTLMSNDKEVS